MYSEEVLKKAKMAVEISQAILDGKEIEYKNGNHWYQTERIGLNFAHYEYRVKPTTELIPFDFSDAEFLIGKVVKTIGGSQFQIIVQLNKTYVFAGVGQMDYNWLLEKYTFLDDSPCGKIK